MERKVLVVDAEQVIRDVLERVFSKADYTVHCAASAEQALEILKQDNIQVAFIEPKLTGMNGVDLCKQIRKDRPIFIIYAVIAYISLAELAECREAGFDDYFWKPFELKVLFKAAEDAFEKLDRWEKQQVRGSYEICHKDKGAQKGNITCDGKDFCIQMT